MECPELTGPISDDDSRGRRHDLARAGEDVAAEHLRGHGLVVLSRNWRCRDGELDIVATDGRTVVICEVKTRSGPDYGSPAEAVTPSKVKRVRDLSRSWLREHEVGWCHVRFDVISVLWPPGGPARIEHIEGAF